MSGRMKYGKRKGAAFLEPPNLKRCRDAVEKLTQDHTDSSVPGEFADQHVFKSSEPGTKSRKTQRKEARKLKKQRKFAFKQNKPLPTKEGIEKERKDKAETQRKRLKEKEKKRNRREKKKQATEQKKQEEELDRLGAEAANKKEDKLIKQLEKQLKLNKRKSKNHPQAFVNDGLDYLLDVVDPTKVSALYEADDEDALFTPGSKPGESDSDIDLGEDSGNSEEEEEEEEEEDGSDEEEEEDEGTNVEEVHPSKEEEDEKQSDNNSSEYSEEDVEETPKTKGILRSNVNKNIKEPEEIGKNTKKVKFSPKLVLQPEIKDNPIKKNAKTPKKSESDRAIHLDAKHIQKEKGSTNPGQKDKKAALKVVKENELSDDELSEDDFDDSNDDESDGDDSGLDADGVVEEESDTIYKEDIYGRLRDKDGNIVEESKASKSTGAYVPPGKRLQMAKTVDEKKKLQLERMKKQIKGLINRLSEANLHAVSTQMEELFRTYSRADVSETLAEVVIEACVSTVLIPERLIMEQAMLLAILHGNVGSEVGATVLQILANKFDQLCRQGSNYGGAKEIDNLLVLFSNMYNFKIIHALLIFDILKQLVDSFGEKDIELLLLILKNVGFSLRKADPMALKEIIITIQKKASSVDTTKFQDQSRMKFMLEIIMAIRNNNMRKIPNYDPSHLEHLKKLLRTYTKGSTSADSQVLRISLQDLLNAEMKGKWWIVGSAWTGRETDNPIAAPDKTSTSLVNEVSNKILELARKQRMNTDVRKNIFCIVMTSEDFVDAFEKLLRLGLKHQQEQEIIHVVMDVCMQEKRFNPFYAYLAQKFCEYHRRFQMTIQFSVWDKLKTMQEMKDQHISNLASFISHLVATKAMSLSIFKVVEFGELDKPKVHFLRYVVSNLLLNYQDYTVQEMFSRISSFPKLHTLRDGLKLFMRHFLLRGKHKGGDGPSETLKQRVELAEKALSAADSKLML